MSVSRRLDEGNARVVWLGGEGGLGKTALALELAWRNAWRFRGVLWVPFDRMAATLGSILAVDKRDFRFEGEGSPRERCDLLARQGYLFVLDNLDEGIAAAQKDRDSEQAQVMDWPRALPRPGRALVSSRVPPGLGVGQGAEPVNPLPVDAAVELFVSAAGRGRDEFDPADVGSQGTIRRICDAVGNMALAVELVAKSYHQLGIIAYARGRYDEAEALYKRSLEITERLGDQAGVLHSHMALAVLMGTRGKSKAAVGAVKRALEQAMALGLERETNQCREMLAFLMKVEDDA